MTTAWLDVALGRAVYAQMLNPQGGIEMDVTVTRVASDKFDVTSGTTTRSWNVAWLRRNLPRSVSICDRTEKFCVVGVMGVTSRGILKFVAGKRTEIDFGHAEQVVLAGVSCRMARVSFVGTLG